MQLRKSVEALRNVLVLAAVAGTVLLSWQLGHALRNSISRTEPQILYRVEIEPVGIRRVVILPGLAPESPPGQAQFLKALGVAPAECVGHTFYTSLPAKCRTADGRLVQVPGLKSNVIVIPPGK